MKNKNEKMQHTEFRPHQSCGLRQPRNEVVAKKLPLVSSQGRT